MRLRELPGHLELGLFILLFRGASVTMSIKELVRFAAALSEWMPPTIVQASRLETAERASERASRLVPGAVCLHRALAARVWLARRGVPTSLVVGFRRDDTLEGHAWLDVESRDGPSELFFEPDYRESFREAELVEPARREPDKWPRPDETEQLQDEETGRG